MTNKEKHIKLFCDGSVNPKSNVGYGAYFILDSTSIIELSQIDIFTKKFENTSSTKLELETLLWALKDSYLQNIEVFVYTDCQNILTLQNRRKKLEQNHFYTKKGELLKNHLLYKDFYKLSDSLNCEFIKVKGHKKLNEKDEIDKLFTLVDRASREHLRNYNLKVNL